MTVCCAWTRVHTLSFLLKINQMKFLRWNSRALAGNLWWLIVNSAPTTFISHQRCLSANLHPDYSLTDLNSCSFCHSVQLILQTLDTSVQVQRFGVKLTNNWASCCLSFSSPHCFVSSTLFQPKLTTVSLHIWDPHLSAALVQTQLLQKALWQNISTSLPAHHSAVPIKCVERVCVTHSDERPEPPLSPCEFTYIISQANPHKTRIVRKKKKKNTTRSISTDRITSITPLL